MRGAPRLRAERSPFVAAGRSLRPHRPPRQHRKRGRRGRHRKAVFRTFRNIPLLPPPPFTQSRYRKGARALGKHGVRRSDRSRLSGAQNGSALLLSFTFTPLKSSSVFSVSSGETLTSRTVPPQCPVSPIYHVLFPRQPVKSRAPPLPVPVAQRARAVLPACRVFPKITGYEGFFASTEALTTAASASSSSSRCRPRVAIRGCALGSLTMQSRGKRPS